MSVRAAALLHGAGGGGWEWTLWRDVLQAHGIAADAPDLQPAAAGLADTRLDDYVDQAAQALAALPRPRAAIGASLGGLIALRIAHAADALVLVNPIPPAPWHARLPRRDWPPIVPWRRDARLASTRRALPDADPATALYAFRRWRDESGLVMREAHAGVEMALPTVRALCIASTDDADVPAAATEALAARLQAELWTLKGASHVGPLLGRDAAELAARVAGWLSRR
jgi:ribosomal protein L12E/L44/L45/RPP1/RPP2